MINTEIQWEFIRTYIRAVIEGRRVRAHLFWSDVLATSPPRRPMVESFLMPSVSWLPQFCIDIDLKQASKCPYSYLLDGSTTFSVRKTIVLLTIIYGQTWIYVFDTQSNRFRFVI